MRVFIFEGIATSGKSTIIQQLKASLTSFNIVIVDEAETHVPIMNDTENIHLDFFNNLVRQKLITGADYIIFDRLYLTQAFRSNSDIDNYKEIEELLHPYRPLTVFLRVSTATIADRIYKASLHRETQWKDYIKTKGRSIEQIAEYYSTQQASQLQLLKSSTIPYKIFDTTEHNYQEITEQLTAIAALD